MRKRLTTPRLLLRPAAREDAQDLLGCLTSDPRIARFLTWRPHQSLGETRTFLNQCEERWTRREAFNYVIAPHATPHPVGMISVLPDRVSTLVYSLARDWWGGGG